ncbi:MAG: ABC-2 family transporter protein [Chloroflexi bacterium]|nr:ABC-2 family transporter protein [Chloroflexota bacterium]
MGGYLGFMWTYVKLNLSSAMEYRAAFVSQVVGMALNDAIMIVFWWLFFLRFPEVGGWQLADILRLWGVLAVAFGLATAVFGNCSRLPALIASGQLDYYLALPKDALLHVLVSRMSVSAWGDVTFGVVAFVAAGDLGVATMALFLVLSLTGCAIFTAYHVLVGSLAFWMGNAEAVGTQASGALVNFSTYPGSIFRGWVKILTFTLIPAALVGHVPVALTRRFDPLVFLGVVAFAVGIAALAVAVFRLGLRRYESGNRVTLRA